MNNRSVQLDPLDKQNDRPQLIDAATTADLLGVSLTTVHRWARDGRLPIAHQGRGTTGARLYDRAEIEALAATAKPKVSL